MVFPKSVRKPSGTYHVSLMNLQTRLNNALSPWGEFALRKYKMEWTEQQVQQHHLTIYRDLLERNDVDGIDLEVRRTVPFS